MTPRYLVSLALMAVAVLIVGALLGFIVPGLHPVLSALLFLAGYGAGLMADLLPPGRMPSQGRVEAHHPYRPASAPVPPPAPVSASPEPPNMWESAEAPSQGRWWTRRVALPATIAGAFIIGFTGAALVLLDRNTDGDVDGQAASDPTEQPASATSGASQPPSPTPTTVATEAPSPTRQPPPTSEPTAAATPAPTLAPPTAAPTVPAATVPPAPSGVQAQGMAAPLTGTYRLTDTITSGSGTGSTYTFSVVLREENGVVTGGGDGLSIAGYRDGSSVSATFTRPGGSGAFAWTAQGDGSYAGTFRDDGIPNSGRSELVRIG